MPGQSRGCTPRPGKKPAYLVAEVEVTNPPAIRPTLAKASETVKKAAGGQFLVLRGKIDSKEGAPVQGVIVIAAFESLADVENWYSSPSYQPLIAERQKAAKTRLYLVEGVAQ